MKRYIQYDSFNVYPFEVDEWPHPVHKHTYFEIIFIRSGEGKHVVNNNTFEYGQGDVFLLGPEDFHYFEVAVNTRFCFIRFAESFFKEPGTRKSLEWGQMLSLLLNTPFQSKGSVVKNEDEKRQLFHLLEVLLYEYKHKYAASYEVMMDSIMKMMLSILARNLLQQNHLAEQPLHNAKPIDNLLLYIRQNIYSPEKLRIEHMAEVFNFSKNYLSIFFKRHTGESLQLYILQYKLKLIENRLMLSSLSFTEIADEFGFTDTSHLHKFVKKYHGKAPSELRKSALL